MKIDRAAEAVAAARLATSAAVALLGPRQVGKTTLARDLAETRPGGAIYLDAERPADLRRLDDADAYLRAQQGRLVVIDEVHRVPGLFPILRGVIDDNRRAGHPTGQFLLLGSASLELAGLASESLAGRISHIDLPGITLPEIAGTGIADDTLWLRGGFPDSLTAPDDAVSARWRADLVRTYLEREVPLFAPRIPATTLHRLWTMLAHGSGTLLNVSRLATGLGLSSPTVDRYIDLLTDLGLVRRLPAWHANVTKRLVKAPKVLVRDSGLIHALLELDSLDALLGHPVVGGSYESFAVENLIAVTTDSHQPFHYRTASGDEVDLVLVRGGEPDVIVEIKRSTAPSPSPGLIRVASDLGIAPERTFIAHPGDGDPYTSHGVTVIGLAALTRALAGGR